MTEQHLISAGKRAVKKFQSNHTAKAKEIAALKAMTPEAIMQRMGVVMLFKGSRTYLKVSAKLQARDRRLQQLGVKLVKASAK